MGNTSGAVALIPLATLGVAEHLAKIKGLEGEANAYKKMGVPKLPGIPDIPKKIKAMVSSEAKSLLEKGRNEIKALLILILAAASIAEIINEINAIIRVINRIINNINKVMTALIPVAKTVFKIIIALTIVYVIAKVCSMIPAVVVAFGTGISFTTFISIARETCTMAGFLLKQLWPIAYAIIAVLLLLLSFFGFLQLIMGILKMFDKSQTDNKAAAGDAFSKKPSDLENSGDDGSDDDMNDGSGVDDDASLIMVECTLPSGEVKQMTAADCIAAGGTFPGMDLVTKLNDINEDINDIVIIIGDMSGTEMVDCLLPDGTIQQMSLNECLAAGGRSLTADELARLLAERDALLQELGDLSGIQLDENIITSLLNPDDSVTVEKATDKKGKRYGFYQGEN